MTNMKPLSERLLDEAKEEERKADHFKGCSYRGEWPGAAYQRQANLLRQAAFVALKDERKNKAKP